MKRIWAGLLLVLAGVLGGCQNQTGRVIETPEDAHDAKIGVMTGSTGEALVGARFPDAEIKSFDDIMDAVAAMKSGQLDAFVVSFPTSLQVVKKNPELKVLEEYLGDEPTAIAVRKGDRALLDAVNAIIAELEAEGVFADMRRRWLKDDLSPYEELDITLPVEGEPLRVGVSATREPFSFVDAEGRVTGHDGELARLIAARLGRPLEFSNMKFMGLIPALQSGRIDLIVTGMSATEERSRFVDFTRSYFDNAQTMTVRRAPGEVAALRVAGTDAAAPAPLRGVADLADKRIGVLLGSAYDDYARKQFPGAEVLQYQNSADVALAVKTGKVDAGLFDEPPLKAMMRADPSFTLFGEPLFSFDVGAGFGKQHTGLRDEFDAFLAGLRERGVYQDMVERWLERGETDMPDIAPATGGPPLVVGVSNGGLPFAAVRDNRLIGFDIELAERFAAHLGRPLRLDNMDFSALIAAAASGKADMTLSAIFITAERKQRIAFSAPYYTLPGRAFTLASRQAAPAPAAAPAQPGFWDSLADSFYSNIVHEKRYLLIWDGLKTTVVISVWSTLFGTLVGALVCYMRMSPSAWLRVPARGYIGLLRGIPVLVFLMLLFYVVFASVDVHPVLVAVIAFGMNFAAYVSEMFRTGIQSIDRGQTEAGLTLGFGRIATFRLIVLPQTIQRILPVYKGEFISLVKMTSIVGYIAVQDLTKASDIIRSRTFDAFFPLVMVAVLYFLIAWVLIQALEYLERATDPKARRARARAG